ncbi:hypothetical protein Q1695_006114 [Nippostrongylus brasiliensis]|nr:hypothetical protein Q1695_006114 [Nippostrongylus brasiliensis]
MWLHLLLLIAVSIRFCTACLATFTPSGVNLGAYSNPAASPVAYYSPYGQSSVVSVAEVVQPQPPVLPQPWPIPQPPVFPQPWPNPRPMPPVRPDLPNPNPQPPPSPPNVVNPNVPAPNVPVQPAAESSAQQRPTSEQAENQNSQQQTNSNQNNQNNQNNRDNKDDRRKDRIKGRKKENSNDYYYYYPEAPQGQGEGDPDDIFYDNQGRVDNQQTQPERVVEQQQQQQQQQQPQQQQTQNNPTDQRTEQVNQETRNICSAPSGNEVPFFIPVNAQTLATYGQLLPKNGRLSMNYKFH